MDVDKYIVDYKTAKTNHYDMQGELFGINALIRTSKQHVGISVMFQKMKLENNLPFAFKNANIILDNYAKDLIFISGNEDDFKESKGYEVEVVDLDSQNKSLYVTFKNQKLAGYTEKFTEDTRYLLELMLENNIIGLIKTTEHDLTLLRKYCHGDREFYGIPVRRKEIK